MMNVLLSVILAPAAVLGCLWLVHRTYSENERFSKALRRRGTLILAGIGIAAAILVFAMKRYWGGTAVGACMNLAAFSMLFAMAAADAKTMTIPNCLSLVGVGLAVFKLAAYLVLLPDQAIGGLFHMALGGLFGAGIFIIAGFFSRGGVGMGDAKMFGVIGLLYGFEATFAVMLGALILMALAGITLMLIKKADRHTHIPMAPFAGASLFLAMLIGLV